MTRSFAAFRLNMNFPSFSFLISNVGFILLIHLTLMALLFNGQTRPDKLVFDAPKMLPISFFAWGNIRLISMSNAAKYLCVSQSLLLEYGTPLAQGGYWGEARLCVEELCPDRAGDEERHCEEILVSDSRVVAEAIHS